MFDQAEPLITTLYLLLYIFHYAFFNLVTIIRARGPSTSQISDLESSALKRAILRTVSPPYYFAPKDFPGLGKDLPGAISLYGDHANSYRIDIYLR